MDEVKKNELFNDVDEMLDIFNEFQPIQNTGTFVAEAIKPTITELIDFAIKDVTEASALKDWLDKTDFWTAPASSKFHGNFKCGLSLHTLKVIQQSLVFARPVLENYYSSLINKKLDISASDIFIVALCHDFCKTNFYTVEYRNTKDITGNWVKLPFYKTKADTRNLGHGNESVLLTVEILPSLLKKRYVLEAISRHMGFSDLSDTESYNYSNFLDNPLVILLQLADQTAAQWFNT